jgi:hypothetical protein
MKTATQSTVARMAGNILSGLVGPYVDHEHELLEEDEDVMVAFAVRIARKTLKEIERTEIVEYPVALPGR